MALFEEREDNFEAAFAHNEQLRFRATARRNRLLGAWAAAKLGKVGAEVDRYAHALVLTDIEGGGDTRVFRKLREDFDMAGVRQSDHQIRRTMDEFLHKAVQDLKSGPCESVSGPRDRNETEISMAKLTLAPRLRAGEETLFSGWWCDSGAAGGRPDAGARRVFHCHPRHAARALRHHQRGGRHRRGCCNMVRRRACASRSARCRTSEPRARLRRRGR